MPANRHWRVERILNQDQDCLLLRNALCVAGSPLANMAVHYSWIEEEGTALRSLLSDRRHYVLRRWMLNGFLDV